MQESRTDTPQPCRLPFAHLFCFPRSKGTGLDRCLTYTVLGKCRASACQSRVSGNLQYMKTNTNPGGPRAMRSGREYSTLTHDIPGFQDVYRNAYRAERRSMRSYTKKAVVPYKGPRRHRLAMSSASEFAVSASLRRALQVVLNPKPPLLFRIGSLNKSVKRRKTFIRASEAGHTREELLVLRPSPVGKCPCPLL